MYGSSQAATSLPWGDVKMRRQAKRIGSLMTVAAVVALAATSSAPLVTAGESMSADSNPDPGVSADVLERERRLLPTFDVLSELPGFQVGGLAAEGDSIFVYWNGEFGAEAQAVVEKPVALVLG